MPKTGRSATAPATRQTGMGQHHNHAHAPHTGTQEREGDYLWPERAHVKRESQMLSKKRNNNAGGAFHQVTQHWN